ncbi:oxidoreductase [Streptomyces sp. NPDC047097]|uniref:oxidoreductase n=1 Tax=Streptomyces sp. NPDC047097 TaxID=3155260 RepID=UPI0033DC5DA5
MSADRRRRWLVTGASRGLGRAATEVVLEAGDSVVATARDTRTLADLTARYGERITPLALDVTDRDAVFATVERAVAEVGGIDVLLNNAGYGLSGGVEEVSERQARDQMEVNFFGALWCTQAVLPVMRRQQAGHILQMSSIAGIATYANLGLYNASKWALEGLSEALSREVKGFGVHITLVEAGEFRTDWSSSSMVRAEPLAAYDQVLAQGRHGMSGAFADRQAGDPRRLGEALLRIVGTQEPPLRLLLGNRAATLAPQVYRERLMEWERWEKLARTVDFDS